MENNCRHDQDLPVAALLNPSYHQEVLADHSSLYETKVDTISSALFDEVQLQSSCNQRNKHDSSVLRSIEFGSCSKFVAMCTSSPGDAFYNSQQRDRTVLHEACLRNVCRHVLKALIQLNPRAAMEKDCDGNTPLHLLFVIHSRVQRVEVDEIDETVADLLAINPVLVASAVNNDGSTPLHTACLSPDSMIHPSIMNRLVTASSMCAEILNKRRQSALSLYCNRHEGSVDIARIIYDAHPQCASIHDSSGKAPLHYAAHWTNTNIIRYMVENAPELANIPTGDSFGRTTLHLICKLSPSDIHLPAIRALLTAAPGTVTGTEKWNDRNTPLHIVCRGLRQHFNVVKILVDTRLTDGYSLGTNPSAAAITNTAGCNPLHYACEMAADVEIIRYLLSAYPAAASAVTRKHDTALHLACAANACTDTVVLLVNANVRALTMTNDYGYNPLHCVCRAVEPKEGIVNALLQAHPSCVIRRTQGGETPSHLACSSGALVSVLEMLTHAQSIATQELPSASYEPSKIDDTPWYTNKVGNTPLHEACFRGVSFEHIETLAKANPEWIDLRNNAGYTPLQIVCKAGRLDERIVNTISSLRGSDVFSVVDSHGHTPLHSACRKGNSISAIQSLIRAYPEALYMQTSYGDTPLHLACLRSVDVSIICEIVESSGNGSVSPVLKPNFSSQTPLTIAMENFQKVVRSGVGTRKCCYCETKNNDGQAHAFGMLSTLVKFIYYGTAREALRDETPTSLVNACMSLHRQNIRLEPAFIRLAIYHRPEEVRTADKNGNYPLHIEASIPVEKMSLLDSCQYKGGCGGVWCHSRSSVLGILLKSYPEATKIKSPEGEFPLGQMILNGRVWDRHFAFALAQFPPALHWYSGMDDKILPLILEKVSRHCHIDTLYELVSARPDFVKQR